MHSVEEAYCLRHHCDKQRFRRDLFWKCLYPHAALFALVTGGLNSRLFHPDRELVFGVARAKTPEHIKEEVHDYFLAPSNKRWLRRRLRMRLSTSRIKSFASKYLSHREQPAGL